MNNKENLFIIRTYTKAELAHLYNPSFVIIGYFGLTSTGMMDRMYVSQRKQLVIGKGENLSPITLWDEIGTYP